MGKTTKNPSHDSRYLGQDFNTGPPEYETVMLTTLPGISVLQCVLYKQILVAASTSETQRRIALTFNVTAYLAAQKWIGQSQTTFWID
jgi:hypothetical protein